LAASYQTLNSKVHWMMLLEAEQQVPLACEVPVVPSMVDQRSRTHQTSLSTSFGLRLHVPHLEMKRSLSM